MGEFALFDRQAGIASSIQPEASSSCQQIATGIPQQSNLWVRHQATLPFNEIAFLADGIGQPPDIGSHFADRAEQVSVNRLQPLRLDKVRGVPLPELQGCFVAPQVARRLNLGGLILRLAACVLSVAGVPAPL